jgi:N-acetylmuramic acid 6-phosphate etherase
MVMDRSKLTTERRNPASGDIDCRPTLQIVDIINRQDCLIAPAVGKQRRAIAAGADLIAAALAAGGRMFYVGAGSSGRLGVLDAAECPPTYGVPPSLVQGIIAGGLGALVRSVEGAEDQAGEGASAIARRRVRAGDVVCGIAACGLTPFVHGALAQARRLGAKTIFLTFAPEVRRQVAGQVDVLINPVVGPEVVTGSTRMKAGTATKLVLNMLTTTAMIKLGKVYGNLMVDLRATNAKLRDRAERIVIAATGADRRTARRLLGQAEGRAKVAILMHLGRVDAARADELLAGAGQSLRRALAVGKGGAAPLRGSAPAYIPPSRARGEARARRGRR